MSRSSLQDRLVACVGCFDIEGVMREVVAFMNCPVDTVLPLHSTGDHWVTDNAHGFQMRLHHPHAKWGSHNLKADRWGLAELVIWLHADTNMAAWTFALPLGMRADMQSGELKAHLNGMDVQSKEEMIGASKRLVQNHFLANAQMVQCEWRWTASAWCMAQLKFGHLGTLRHRRDEYEPPTVQDGW
jgi:hypothetical protein